MLNRQWIEKAETFLLEKLNAGAYLSAHPEAKNYRIEHSFRVANIGREIAQKEGLDETEMVIACLLHDISYCEEFGENGWIEHGRRSAAIARPFLEKLGMAEDRIADLCYGIAIHVDDEAGFAGERTPFALSIGDADNIDRFDAFRIHETLSNDGFLTIPFEEKQKYVKTRLDRLKKLKEMPMGTQTAQILWKERISFYNLFYEKLGKQLESSKHILS